jgi:hypothetical protein
MGVDTVHRGSVSVFDTDGNRHIIPLSRANQVVENVKDGYIELADDHKCKECYNYVKGERKSWL